MSDNDASEADEWLDSPRKDTEDEDEDEDEEGEGEGGRGSRKRSRGGHGKSGRTNYTDPDYTNMPDAVDLTEQEKNLYLLQLAKQECGPACEHLSTACRKEGQYNSREGFRYWVFFFSLQHFKPSSSSCTHCLCTRFYDADFATRVTASGE